MSTENKKHAGGRPVTPIKWEEFDKLCMIQCTQEEVAFFFNCTVDTISNRVKKEKGMSFSEYFAIRRANRRISLRRAQYQLAQKKPAMSIWLGKQYLNQKDISRQELTGADGDAIKFSDEQMTDEEIDREVLRIFRERGIMGVAGRGKQRESPAASGN